MLTFEEYQQNRQLIRTLVRARVDFQEMRISMDNRCGLTAKGKQQDLKDRRVFTGDDFAMIHAIGEEARKNEKDCEKKLLTVLKRMPIYLEWLANIKGVGPASAGWILGEFDIFKMDTVSKAWQYAGLNPGMVRGKQRKEKKGKLKKDEKSFEIVTTDIMVRGDKLTPKFVSPFNTQLRKALCGVMADGFIKQQNHYALEFYYPYKNRLEQSSNTVEHIKSKGAKPETMAWKDVNTGRRDRAAKRYMIKMFLADLYNQWRPIYNLNVRPSYQEEKLGHIHKSA